MIDRNRFIDLVTEHSDEGKPLGLLILAVDREEVALINMLGTIDLSNLEMLGLDEATLDSLAESMEDEGLER